MSDRIAVMSEGDVEQIGTPTEIYDEPATVFVAGFIGQANLWPCEDRPHQRLGHRGHRRSAAGSPRLRRTGLDAGTPVTLMVRPERLRVSIERTRPRRPRCRHRHRPGVPGTGSSGSAWPPATARAGGPRRAPTPTCPLLRPGDEVWVGWESRLGAGVLPGRPPGMSAEDYFDEQLAEDWTG